MFRASRALTLGLPAAAALGMVLGANAPPVPAGPRHLPAGLAAAIRHSSVEPRPPRWCAPEPVPSPGSAVVRW
jgi:hypothetical protein